MPREHNDWADFTFAQYNGALSNRFVDNGDSFVLSTQYDGEEIQRLVGSSPTTASYLEVPTTEVQSPITGVGFARSTLECRITCAVCGEEFIVPPNSELGFICPKCKKAVLKMRSMMSEEDLI